MQRSEHWSPGVGGREKRGVANQQVSSFSYARWIKSRDLVYDMCLQLTILYCTLKNMLRGFPWWCSGWESACQCRAHGFEPWSGKIPHAAEQLGPWATTTEPARLEPVLCNKRGRDGEGPTHRDEEWPPLAATGEGPSAETRTQHSHK